MSRGSSRVWRLRGLQDGFPDLPPAVLDETMIQPVLDLGGSRLGLPQQELLAKQEIFLRRKNSALRYSQPSVAMWGSPR